MIPIGELINNTTATLYLCNDHLFINWILYRLDLLEAQLLQSTDYDSSSVHQQQKTIIQQHKHKQGTILPDRLCTSTMSLQFSGIHSQF